MPCIEHTISCTIKNYFVIRNIFICSTVQYANQTFSGLNKNILWISCAESNALTSFNPQNTKSVDKLPTWFNNEAVIIGDNKKTYTF